MSTLTETTLSYQGEHFRFDNVPIADWPCFGLTTYAQPTADLVSRTIRIIQQSLANELPNPLHERLPGELVVRTSARVPRSGVIQTADGLRIWRAPPAHK